MGQKERSSFQIDQSSTLSPAQPAYIFRGHSAQIHAVHFFRENVLLISGDANGWVIVWSIPTRRPVVVWRPHHASILGIGSWGEDRIITHGRDNKLLVWQLRQGDQTNFSTVLPIDDTVTERKSPWLLHSLAVNALNFCSFAICPKLISQTESVAYGDTSEMLIATPGVADGYMNVTSLPNEERIATIPSLTDVRTGMVMAIGICYIANQLTIVGGYESGHTAIWQQEHPSKPWQVKYMNKSHTQPILSLDITPDQKYLFASSADAIIVRHHLLEFDTSAIKTVQTKHAGQQSLSVRSDGKIFATAGWDGRLRVYSPESMRELAVLKWHKEGCYALTFAKITTSTVEDDTGSSSVIKRELTVSEQRRVKATSTHWVAAGSKDGKVSLWDIY